MKLHTLSPIAIRVKMPAKMFPAAREKAFPLVDMSFVILSAIATAMLLSRTDALVDSKEYLGAKVPPTDTRWNVGVKYGLVWASVPVFLLCITGLSLAMQDGPAAGARKRFGPDAYWREALRVVGQWEVIGIVDRPGQMPTSPSSSEYRTLEFKPKFLLIFHRNGYVSY